MPIALAMMIGLTLAATRDETSAPLAVGSPGALALVRPLEQPFSVSLPLQVDGEDVRLVSVEASSPEPGIRVIAVTVDPTCERCASGGVAPPSRTEPVEGYAIPAPAPRRGCP